MERRVQRQEGRNARSVRRQLASLVLPLAAAVSLLAPLATSGPSAAAVATTRTTTTTTLPGAPPVTESYGTSPYETATVYPAPAPGAPLVVLVHGGGWESSLDKTYQPSQSASLQAAGFAVFVLNYDPASPATGAFPVQLDDVTAGIGWAVANAATYNADPTNVELLGGSAGGQLVSLVAEQLDVTSPGTVRAVVTLSGALDLVALMQNVAAHTVSGYVGLHLRLALGCASKRTPCTTAVESEWSPTQNVTPADCPPASLVINDTQELMPVAQADDMTAALQADGCAVTELLQPGRNHSFAGWKGVQTPIIAFLAAN